MAEPGKAEVDISKIAATWDQVPEIRNRIRDEGALLHPEGKEKVTLKTTVLNANVLAPVLERMTGVTGSQKLPVSPAVEDLREEISNLYALGKREVDFCTIDRAAWKIRNFLAFLKVKGRKQEVSHESWLNMCGLVFFLCCSLWWLISLKVMCRLYRAMQDPEFQRLIVILNPELQVP